jgi:hypothetical protein
MLNTLRRLSMLVTSAVASIVSLGFAPAQTWAQNGPAASTVTTTVASSPAASIDGQVQNLVLKGDSLEVTYKNIGSQPTAIVGELQVHVTEDDIVSSTVFANALLVKPGATQRFKIAMPKIAKGKYTLVAIVDYGGAQMTAAMATLEMR